MQIIRSNDNVTRQMSRISSLQKINRMVKDSYSSFVTRKKAKKNSKTNLNDSLFLSPKNFKKKKSPKFLINNKSKKKKEIININYIKSCISLKNIKLINDKENRKQKNRCEKREHIFLKSRKKRKKSFKHFSDFTKSIPKRNKITLFFDTLLKPKLKTRKNLNLKNSMSNFKLRRAKHSKMFHTPCYGKKLNKTVSPNKRSYFPLFG